MLMFVVAAAMTVLWISLKIGSSRVLWPPWVLVLSHIHFPKWMFLIMWGPLNHPFLIFHNKPSINRGTHIMQTPNGMLFLMFNPSQDVSSHLLAFSDARPRLNRNGGSHPPSRQTSKGTSPGIPPALSARA
jgi:hypothetical protein